MRDWYCDVTVHMSILIKIVIFKLHCADQKLNIATTQESNEGSECASHTIPPKKRIRFFQSHNTSEPLAVLPTQIEENCRISKQMTPMTNYRTKWWSNSKWKHSRPGLRMGCIRRVLYQEHFTRPRNKKERLWACLHQWCPLSPACFTSQEKGIQNLTSPASIISCTNCTSYVSVKGDSGLTCLHLSFSRTISQLQVPVNTGCSSVTAVPKFCIALQGTCHKLRCPCVCQNSATLES